MRFSTPSLLLCLSLLVAACGENAPLGPDAGGDSGAGPDAAPNRPDAGPGYADGDWLYLPDTLLTVDIEIAPDNWDRLRFETRSILSLFGPECAQHPAYSPFTYVPATVTVEGITLEQVGVRKKGFLGSLDSDKPSLKISFDEYLPGQRLSGLERLTLNNAKQDPSYLDQCLGYQLFAQAGVPAPRCNYARVSVNGTPLGLYVNVEPIKKPFLARYFADPEGDLYEGTLSDFRAGWTATFEPKTNSTTADLTAIQGIADALALDDAAMLAELEQRIDLDRFFSFWAIEAIVSHWDGYTGNANNFYLYRDPDTGRFTFIPWGDDQLFGEDGPDPGLTRSAIARRLYLYQPSRERYLARYQEILDTVWDDGDVLDEITRVATLISSTILVSESQQFSDSLAQLRSAVTGREGRLRDRLAVAGPGDADPLSEPMCFETVGSVQATFSVPWGSSSQDVTFEVTVDGTDVPLTNLAAAAGPSDDQDGYSDLYLVGSTSGNRTVVVLIVIPDSMVAPGTLATGTDDIDTAMVVVVEGVEQPEAYYFPSGPLVLESGAASSGSQWQGSVDLTLWYPPWL